MSERTASAGAGALVTGASAGIGRELALRIAARGRPVALTARSDDRLRELADEIGTTYGVAALPVADDLEDPAAPGRIAAALEEAGFEVDLLVNNAGFGTWGAFAGRSRESQAGMVRVNVLALTDLTHRFLPGMRARGRGRILNVASTAAFQPGPFMAVYFATKAYVLHFSEALREELRGTGITVTVLCPGPTRTEFQGRAGMEGTRVGRNPLVMEAGQVAEAGLRGALEGRAIVVPGLANRIGARLPRLLPRAAVRKVAAFVNGER